jgi:hypothetical protein
MEKIMLERSYFIAGTKINSRLVKEFNISSQALVAHACHPSYLGG